VVTVGRQGKGSLICRGSMGSYGTILHALLLDVRAAETGECSNIHSTYITRSM
jgi:hypothetical protein